MTTDQPARTPEDEQCAFCGKDFRRCGCKHGDERSALIGSLADEVVAACDLDDPNKKPRGSRGTIAGACGDAWDAGYAAAQDRHAREVAALKAGVERLNKGISDRQALIDDASVALSRELGRRVDAEADLAALKNLNHACLVRAEDAERDLAALHARIEAAAREDSYDVRHARMLGDTAGWEWLGRVVSVLDAARADNAGLREMLRDIVDGAWADADDKGFKFCIWCQLAHHEDTPAGDDVHERDCQIRAAERALASNSGERT